MLGVHYLGFTVRDLARSEAWYCSVFSLAVLRRNIGGSSWAADWDEVLLRHPSGLLFGLMKHRVEDDSPFSEYRVGLDHVEFEVPTWASLQQWRRRLDALTIAHTSSRPHLVTFRDPDNIQLELFWPGHGEPTPAPARSQRRKVRESLRRHARS
jgi:glyoxylase I family protein